MSRVKPNLTVISMMACLLGLPVTVGRAQAPTPVPAPASAAAPVPAAPSPPVAEPVPASAPAAVQAPEVALTPAPAAPPPPLPPPAQAELSMQQFTLPSPRVVLLLPQKRAVSVRPERKYGDAGAPFSVGMGLTLSWPSDAGYALFGLDEPQRRFEIFATYDVWHPTERLVVAAGTSFRTLLGGDGTLAEIHERTWLGELNVRYTLTPWLFPHLRVAGGVAGTEISIDDDALSADGDRGVTFEDKDWSAIGSVGAGFTLRTKARTFETHSGHMSSLSFGVLLEGGYSLAPAMKVKLGPDRSPSSGVSLTTAKPGSLERSAPYLRIAAVARF